MKSGVDSVATAPFRIKRGRMVRWLLMRHALWWLLAMVAVALALIATGVAIDLRLCVLGLMVVCMCMPMATAMVLISHGLAPVNALNMLEHRVVITPDAITVEVMGCESDEAGDDCHVEKKVVISMERAGAYTVTDGAVAVPVRGAEHRRRSGGVLMLPYSAFGSTKEFSDAVAMLTGASRGS